MTNKTKTYSTEFKESVLRKLKTGELKSIEEARRVYSIGGKMTIQKWAEALKVNIGKGEKIKTVADSGSDKLLKALGISYLRILELEDKTRLEHEKILL
jgi:transposase-like protein